MYIPVRLSKGLLHWPQSKRVSFWEVPCPIDEDTEFLSSQGEREREREREKQDMKRSGHFLAHLVAALLQSHWAYGRWSRRSSPQKLRHYGTTVFSWRSWEVSLQRELACSFYYIPGPDQTRERGRGLGTAAGAPTRTRVRAAAARKSDDGTICALRALFFICCSTSKILGTLLTALVPPFT